MKICHCWDPELTMIFQIKYFLLCLVTSSKPREESNQNLEKDLLLEKTLLPAGKPKTTWLSEWYQQPNWSWIVWASRLSINQSINQSVNQSINQSINQLINHIVYHNSTSLRCLQLSSFKYLILTAQSTSNTTICTVEKN